MPPARGWQMWPPELLDGEMKGFGSRGESSEIEAAVSWPHLTPTAKTTPESQSGLGWKGP